jgi:anaerobic selenocysteine-containing dehydrogenase
MPVSRTVCNFCHVRCPAVVEIQDERVIRIDADAEHPFGGLMCVKGKAAGELRDHPDRLLFPLKRVGPKTQAAASTADPGMWQRVSWDEALADIARQLQEIKAESGAEAIVFGKGTPSGTGLVDAERWLKRLSNLLGTPNTISTTHLCQWPRDEGTRYTYGVRMPTPDLERSGCFLLWGCNPSATNIRMAHAIQQARARGMKLITVDPRRVGVATQSDLHLFVQPGTDGALALSIAHVLVERGWIDADFVRDWTNAPFLVRRDSGRLLRWSEVAPGEPDGSVVWTGEPTRCLGPGPSTGRNGHPPELDAAPTVTLATGEVVATATAFHLLRELLAAYPPERGAAICGVPADDIRAAAELLATNHPVAHYFWNGITQHTNAAQNGRAISVLYALLGDFDAPGGNILTPRPAIRNVQLDDLLTPEIEERRLGWAERPLGGPRTSASSAAYDLYRAVVEGHPYPVRALMLFGSNMVMTNGDSLEGRAALQQLDFMVAVDHFLTPTAQLADYVLPATIFLEAPALTFGFELPIAGQTHLQYRAPVVAPRGEARSDTQVIFDLAVRLGYGDRFWNGDLEAAFRDELEPSGIALQALQATPTGIQTRPKLGPLPGRTYAREADGGSPRGFATPTGRVELYATKFAEHDQDPLPAYTSPRWSPDRDPDLAAYPFALTNAKMPQFCHGQHRGLPSLRRARPHPEVELHPDTAAQAGVSRGAWVAVETPEGAMRARARLNPAIKPGVVVAQAGWWQACEELELPGYPAYSSMGANVNLLVSNRWRDPISGGTPFRSARCRLRPLPAGTAPLDAAPTDGAV